MPRLSFKPDASFFRKIVIGAVGARGVRADLLGQGHELVELERGSTDSKLWKDVKRKRVRIPDLVCLRCGVRVESRAKTNPDLSMSHSATDAERAWDFGMVDSDWIAFPVCENVQEADWSAGVLDATVSYWRQKQWVHWQIRGHINYLTVAAFRSRVPARSRTKGVEEGSENLIGWNATFSTRDGAVELIDTQKRKVAIRRSSDNHLYTWTVKPEQELLVAAGQRVEQNQLIASTVRPITGNELQCSQHLPTHHIGSLLSSRERTQRFTGAKLARLLRRSDYETEVSALTSDSEEDVYVRLEGLSYLTSVCGHSAASLFAPYLNSGDAQIRLEAVIALGEAASPEALELLGALLDDTDCPFFLRSAAAWSLSQIGSDAASMRLVRAFGDIDVSLREDALDGLVSIGREAFPALLAGLRSRNLDVVAGCAEAIRRHRALPKEVVRELIGQLHSDSPKDWAVWLVGHLPREYFNSSIAQLQRSKPELHYAISLLWSFVESWIARHWELKPRGALFEE